MSDKLKKFVTEQRQEFDTDGPAEDLWEKIDARIGAQHSSRITSKWLKKFKYLAFSASILAIAICFISTNLNNSSTNHATLNTKDPAPSDSEQYLKDQNSSASNAGENNSTEKTNDLSTGKKKSTLPASSNKTEQGLPSGYDSLQERNISDHNETQPESFPNSLAGEIGKTSSTNEKKETNSAKNSKKTEIHVPAEPGQMNTYTGTLYEGSSICAVLRAFKFPGKASKDLGGSNHKENKRVTFKTVSCSDLENIPNLKAVWLKGRTDKEMTLSVKKRFKNIVLEKKDGRKLNAVAISHYYRGRYVITEFKGLYFKMIFKDKVEFILFFKDAEEGDKIVIDGIIEAVVKAQP